jgi:parallel beta-helix repeat protein
MKLLLPLLCVCLLNGSASVLAQGSLTPPGTPAPTMKTLQQVEPRIDLQNAPASAVSTTNVNYHYQINLPGSYYLSANIGVTKLGGIHINTEGVTLDLNGFEISRTASSGGDGIAIAATAHRATVRNGSLKGLGHGIRSIEAAGVPARGCAFRDLTVSNCTQIGINAGRGATVESCRVQDNSGSYGIYAAEAASISNCVALNNNVVTAIWAGSGSTLTNSTAVANTGTNGIYAGAGSVLTNCAARGNTVDFGIAADAGVSLTNCSAVSNGSAAAVSAGFDAGLGTVLVNCAAYSQQSTAATPTGTTGAGFRLTGGNVLKNSTARFNFGDGIHASTRCLITDNVSTANGVNAGSGMGIHVTGADNRIEGNNVIVNDRGYLITAAGNIILRNTASGNGVNWDVVTGNVILVVNATTAGAISGNSGGTAPGSTDPNANFTY